MKKVFFTFSFILLLSFPALGQANKFHLEAIGSFGQGSSYAEEENESPDNLYYELGLTGGYFFTPSFYIGITSSYQKIGQSSDADKPHGNRSGKRLELLSPTLGIRFLPLYLKFEYSVSGDYEIEQNTVAEEELSYSKTSGYRLSAFYVSSGNPILGVYYEDLAFKEELLDSEAFTLDDELKITQYGISVGWVF